MHVWLARSASGTRFRLEVDGHPGILQYHGWSMREGELDDATYKALCDSRDEVEIERLHQELWQRLTPTP